MKNLILFLFIVLLGTSAHAQINIPIGGEFTIDAHHHDIMYVPTRVVNTITDRTFQFTLLEKNSEGCKLNCKLIRIKSRDERPTSGVQTFNSDSLRSTSIYSSAVINHLMFLEKSFRVVLAPNGKVLRLEGVDDLVKQTVAKWQLDSELQSWVNLYAQTLLPEIKNMFLEMPPQKVGYLSTWTSRDPSAEYKVTAIAGALLTITANSGDTLTAKYTFNEANGLAEIIELDRKMPEIADQRFAVEQKYSHKIDYDKHIVTTADTAWANMAVNLSVWNSKMRKNGVLDSASVFAYLKQYDPLYSDDPYYITQKLSLVNELAHFENGIYDSLLLKTPNQYIRSYDRDNKMKQVMSTDIDQVYDYAKYYAKYPEFSYWVQGSMAPDLVFVSSRSDKAYQARLKYYMNYYHSEAKAKAEVARQDRKTDNNALLLERLHADKDPAMRAFVGSMYLWIKAYQNKKDKKLLAKTSKSFNKLNDKEMKAGNGGRYGLLLYKIMSDAAEPKYADVVLDRTIGAYEKLIKDTTGYANKAFATDAYYAEKNILMDAYYVKYKQWKKLDSVKALSYLAKAAFYSPVDEVTENRRNYSDRMMADYLGGVKPDCRKEYLDYLFAKGLTNEAATTLAAQINADMSSLSEMQKLFEKHFPDKHFADFVKNNIIANWDDAPAFSVKGLNDKSYNLDDYKGKWLILDFWGTWCPPCRKEMPEVDRYNIEINQGKHPGIAMLGVAVDDNEERLVAFMKQNNYGIKAVLQAEGLFKYHLTGVPSKYLVSPNGKMVLLNAGNNWQQIVGKLNELYAAN